MIDMKTIKCIHFIGVGGVSMSGIAAILKSHHYEVTGSDQNDSAMTQKIKSEGVKIYIGHDEKNIDGADLIVYSAAVHEDNVEFAAAKKKGLPLLSRAEMLGYLMKDYKVSVGVSGTHGKTTTTAMVTTMLNREAINPTVLAGTFNKELNSHIQVGDKNLIITEACEYTRSFLNFFPTVGVILNIEEDHLDYYKDLDEIKGAFYDYTLNIPEGGTLVINADDENCKEIIGKYTSDYITFGLNEDAYFQGKNIRYNDLGHGNFDLYIDKNFIKSIQLSVPGRHNIYNALAALAVAYVYVDDINPYVTYLEKFTGVGRRFEFKGTLNNSLVFDDYAHHPSEIKTTLDGIKKIKGIEKVICVFQPHTFSRTKELLEEFSNAFGDADEVILADIYASREVDPGNIHSKDLLNLLCAKNINAKYFDSFSRIEDYLITKSHSKNLLITLGAGDVYKIADHLIENK